MNVHAQRQTVEEQQHGHDEPFNFTNFVTDYFHNFTLNNGEIPYPFAPPSWEYCDSTSTDEELSREDDDIYVSIFKPCIFTFYQRSADATVSSSTSTGNDTTTDSTTGVLTCTEVQDTMIQMTTEERRVYGWPDTCVANGSRCYSLHDHPFLYNYTSISEPHQKEYVDMSVPFPEGAEYVSVDCSFDYVQAQKFMEEFPDDVAIGVGVVMFVIFMIVTVVSCCILCCCCGVGLTCCGDPCCGGTKRRTRKRGQYREVLPIQYGNGLPAFQGFRVEV